eukprot:Blabericola_migrator_1__12921@NODE_84_length_14850_cov_98_458703_g75_i0_p10_GENE_NODE_84_length_14850_cov_98_458703_g75_i0NODE_84_length_14850_cov_98_458703_g75_i0_p10_ORF_typecomplete_len170_score14_44_NODE_84_length_14850_cov_98_458703_g75_i085429051
MATPTELNALAAIDKQTAYIWSSFIPELSRESSVLWWQWWSDEGGDWKARALKLYQMVYSLLGSKVIKRVEKYIDSLEEIELVFPALRPMDQRVRLMQCLSGQEAPSDLCASLMTTTVIKVSDLCQLLPTFCWFSLLIQRKLYAKSCCRTPVHVSDTHTSGPRPHKQCL